MFVKVKKVIFVSLLEQCVSKLPSILSLSDKFNRHLKWSVAFVVCIFICPSCLKGHKSLQRGWTEAGNLLKSSFRLTVCADDTSFLNSWTPPHTWLHLVTNMDVALSTQSSVSPWDQMHWCKWELIKACKLLYDRICCTSQRHKPQNSTLCSESAFLLI